MKRCGTFVALREYPDHYPTKIVIRITRLSARQLQWWDERRILRPDVKRKHTRLYSRSDLMRLIILKRVGDAGLRVRKFARKLQSVEMRSSGWLIVDMQSGTPVFYEQPTEALAVLSRMKRFAMIFDMNAVATSLTLFSANAEGLGYRACAL